MEVAIAKVIKTKEEIDDAKGWCRRCIEKRLNMDSLYGDLDKIKYSVTRYIYTRPNASLGFKVEARLEL